MWTSTETLELRGLTEGQVYQSTPITQITETGETGLEIPLLPHAAGCGAKRIRQILQYSGKIVEDDEDRCPARFIIDGRVLPSGR